MATIEAIVKEAEKHEVQMVYDYAFSFGLDFDEREKSKGLMTLS